MRHQQDRNEVANDLTLFGLSNDSRADLKRRYLEGRAKLREVVLFYGVKKKCAEEIVADWKKTT
jgi:hypothetical protein